MRPSELQEKSIVGTGGKIGSVSDIEFDPAEWKVTHLRIKLTNETVKTLDYKKPFMGHVEILLLVGPVKAVSDVATLTNAIAELKDFIEPTK